MWWPVHVSIRLQDVALSHMLSQWQGPETGTYTDVLSQGDHPLVTFDAWGSLEERAG